MTFDQFFRILRARWLLALSVMGALVVITMGICLWLPKSYKATASVMVDLKPDPVAGMAGNVGLQSATLMATQIDIITSPALATRVARQIGMDNNDDVRAQWLKATKGKGDYLTWVGEFIGQSLEVKPSRESNIIDIAYTSVDPKFAAVLANAFAKAYMDSSVQFRVDPARQYYSFFEERAKLARDKLEAAQVKLAQAQKERGIVATDERLDAESARLNDLSSQIVALRAAQADTSVRSATANKSADQMQDVLNNSLITTLKADISRYEAKLEELQSRFGDAHPQVIETKATLDSLRERQRIETSKLTKSLNINDNITSSRSAAARAAYEEQRNKVLQLKDARNELAVLEREVDSAQKVYDAIQARCPGLPVILLTAHTGVEVAVEAMKHGAYHYANKPFNLDEVSLVVRQALETTRLRREVKTLRANQAQPYSFDRIVGGSAALVSIKGLMRKVASSPASTCSFTCTSGKLAR